MPPVLQTRRLTAAEIANPSGLLLQHSLPQLPNDYLLQSFRCGQHPSKKMEEKTTIRVAVPVFDEETVLLASQLLNPDGEIVAYSYMQALKRT